MLWLFAAPARLDKFGILHKGIKAVPGIHFQRSAGCIIIQNHTLTGSPAAGRNVYRLAPPYVLVNIPLAITISLAVCFDKLKDRRWYIGLRRIFIASGEKPTVYHESEQQQVAPSYA